MTRILLSCAGILLAPIAGGVPVAELSASRQGQDPGKPVAVRFHHVHYRVDDPASAMRDTHTRLGGTRVILQGIGVGVRLGREYVLFDREAHETGAPELRGRRWSATDAYREAAAWLRTREGLILPETAPAGPVLQSVAGADDDRVDHIAFAVDDLAATRAALDAQPFAAHDESARYRLPSGLVLEIVRDTGRPDSHWCPMHPDVRAPGGASCPLCGMDLVPIPAPRIGEYRLDVGIVPRAGSGASGLRLVVRDPETAAPVTRFLDVHERLFHLFIVKRDLAEFHHVHPDQHDDGSFVLRHELAGGEYLLVADFLPAGGTPQMVQRAIVTPGYAGRLFAPPPSIAPTPLEQSVDGLRVRLDASSVVPLRRSSLRFVVSDASTGAPITDIEPYLGASGHLLLVDRDLTMAIHGHPDGPVSSGPEIVFDPVLPAPGLYKLWLQFQRNGRVLTVPFVIEVPQP